MKTNRNSKRIEGIWVAVTLIINVHKVLDKGVPQMPCISFM